MSRKHKSGRLSPVSNELHAIPVDDPIEVSQDNLIHKVASWVDIPRNTFGIGNCVRPDLRAITVCGIGTTRMRFSRSLQGERCPVCWPSYFERLPNRKPSLRVVRGCRKTDEDIPF